MDTLTANGLRDLVGPTRILSQYQVFPEINSTNTYLQESRESPEGLVVVADYQTCGRGRQGRAWVAPPGSSIHCSVLLRPPLSFANLYLLTAACALSVRDAVVPVVQGEVWLKWPNDVLLESRKLCGILTDVELPVDELPRMVLGFGVNVHTTPPPEVAPNATCVARHAARRITRIELLADILRRYDIVLTALYAGVCEDIWQNWRASLHTLGQNVQVRGEGGAITGRAVDVARDGGLILETEPGKTPQVVYAGEAIEQPKVG